MDFLKSSVRNRSGTIFDLLLPISDSRKILSVMHAVATMGTPHSVRIYYGEYAVTEFEKPEKWYSDVNTFELWLFVFVFGVPVKEYFEQSYISL